MKINSVRMAIATTAFGIAANGMIVAAAHAEEYSFTATNTDKTVLTEVLVSENKKDWGYFDIGTGIAPGATVNLIWDQSTNSDNCSQWVKGTWADGTESEPAKFDFCENGLKIDF